MVCTDPVGVSCVIPAVLAVDNVAPAPSVNVPAPVIVALAPNVTVPFTCKVPVEATVMALAAFAITNAPPLITVAVTPDGMVIIVVPVKLKKLVFWVMVVPPTVLQVTVPVVKLAGKPVPVDCPDPPFNVIFGELMVIVPELRIVAVALPL